MLCSSTEKELFQPPQDSRCCALHQHAGLSLNEKGASLCVALTFPSLSHFVSLSSVVLSVLLLVFCKVHCEQLVGAAKHWAAFPQLPVTPHLWRGLQD